MIRKAAIASRVWGGDGWGGGVYDIIILVVVCFLFFRFFSFFFFSKAKYVCKYSLDISW